jgi:hypothetical protein
MSALTIQESPFEVIRGNRADGSGFWSGQELIQLLSRFKLETHLEVLNAQECGLLILEAAASNALDVYPGVTQDAAFLCHCAFSIYKGQSATFLFHAVQQMIQQASRRESSEDFLYRVIEKHFKALFPNAELVDRNSHCDRRDIPDYFVSIDGNLIPVEVKADVFNRVHLQQLNRYITKYQPKKLGFAIAPSLDPKLELPKKIKFIPLDKNRILQLENFVSLRDTLAVKSAQIILERDARLRPLDRIFLGFRQLNIKEKAA